MIVQKPKRASFWRDLCNTDNLNFEDKHRVGVDSPSWKTTCTIRIVWGALPIQQNTSGDEIITTQALKWKPNSNANRDKGVSPYGFTGAWSPRIAKGYVCPQTNVTDRPQNCSQQLGVEIWCFGTIVSAPSSQDHGTNSLQLEELNS